MARPTDRRDATRTKAQKHFVAAERRNATFREEVERERAARDAKNTELRALRLAKEVIDKAAAAEIAEAKAAEKARLEVVRAARKKRVPAA